MDQKQIREIIEKAIKSPSGDNCQPWSFAWDGIKLSIYHDERRAYHPLNAGQRASWIALGCMLESIKIAASAIKYVAEIEVGTLESGNDDPWAVVHLLSKEGVKADPLFDYLEKRTTDRRLYQGGELNNDLLQTVLERSEEYRPAGLFFVDHISQNLEKYILESEAQMMEHPEVMINILKWTHLSTRKAKKSGDGLSWRNMSVRLFEVPGIWLIKKFPFLMKLVRRNLVRQHRERIKAQIQTAAGLICVTVPKSASTPKDIVNAAGMIMRTWLLLTSQAYGCQPLTMSSTLIYLMNQQLLDEHFAENIEIFEEGEKLMHQEFGIPEDQTPVWMIRTGRSSELPEKLRTFRRSADDLIRGD